jgi:hypothetical protein
MLTSRQKLIKNLALPLALLVFVALFSVDIFFVPRAEASGVPAGEVAGAENCQPVAWYIFFLLLLAYLFLVNLNFWYKFKEQKEPCRFCEVVLTVLALIGWYYLDICRTNRWFVYAVIISGFVCYLVYLHYFKKKLIAEESATVY